MQELSLTNIILTHTNITFNYAAGVLTAAVITNLESDLTPSLGGNLDINSKFIQGLGGIKVMSNTSPLLTGTKDELVVIEGYFASAEPATIQFRRGRGTSTAKAPIRTGDSTGMILFEGWTDIPGEIWAPSAAISADIDGTITSTTARAKLNFITFTNSTTPVIVGDASFNGIGSNIALRTGVYATSTERDVAIPTPVAGMMVVTGTAFQGYTGSAWVTLG